MVVNTLLSHLLSFPNLRTSGHHKQTKITDWSFISRPRSPSTVTLPWYSGVVRGKRRSKYGNSLSSDVVGSGWTLPQTRSRFVRLSVCGSFPTSNLGSSSGTDQYIHSSHLDRRVGQVHLLEPRQVRNPLLKKPKTFESYKSSVSRFCVDWSPHPVWDPG